MTIVWSVHISVKRMKQHADLEKIFVSHRSDKGLISRIYLLKTFKKTN